MSKIELESKILEVDKSKLIDSLVELGAIKVFDAEMEAVYYFKDGVIDTNSALRLRREDTEVVLAYKSKLNVSGISKSFNEIEVIVNDFDQMNKILISLGFQIYNTNKKKRISYKINETRFEIDEYLDNDSNIPIFLEIETTSDILINEYISKLKLSQNKIVNYNFFELKKYYENK